MNVALHRWDMTIDSTTSVHQIHVQSVIRSCLILFAVTVLYVADSINTIIAESVYVADSINSIIAESVYVSFSIISEPTGCKRLFLGPTLISAPTESYSMSLKESALAFSISFVLWKILPGPFYSGWGRSWNLAKTSEIFFLGGGRWYDRRDNVDVQRIIFEDDIFCLFEIMIDVPPIRNPGHATVRYTVCTLLFL